MISFNYAIVSYNKKLSPKIRIFKLPKNYLLGNLVDDLMKKNITKLKITYYMINQKEAEHVKLSLESYDLKEDKMLSHKGAKITGNSFLNLGFIEAMLKTSSFAITKIGD